MLYVCGMVCVYVCACVCMYSVVCTYVSLIINVQRMCIPFPSFLKPPSLNVPDMIVPKNLNPTSATQTGYHYFKAIP